MTVQDMQNRVAFMIDDNSGKNYAPADLLMSLNIGQDNVAKELVALNVGWFEKPADLNPNGTPPGTTPGVELYKLPGDFVKFSRVERSDTGYPLHLIDMNNKIIAGQINNPIANLVTYQYFVTGNYMGINPIPQAAVPIRMWYVYDLPSLVLTTDVSEIPERWHDMVCVGAALDFITKDEGDPTPLVNQWNRYLVQLHQTESVRSTQEPRGVTQVSNSYGY